MITLRHLTIYDQEKFMQALSADWEKNFDFAHYWDTMTEKNFASYIKIIPEMALGMHLPKGHVPCTFLFAFNSEGELVGRTSIRHELTDYLMKYGGHVGYGVVPAHRRKGHASAILAETLNYIKENLPHLSRILLTCDESNTGSRKTIENNGGILEDILPTTAGEGKMRYWINI